MGATVTTQHLRTWFAGLVVLMAMVLIGCSGEAPPASPPAAPKVTVAHPELRKLTRYAEFNGWLQPDRTQEVRARVRGHIKKVHFYDGQMVKKGDLLFEIDPRPFQAALDAATAQLNAADAALELAQSEYKRSSYLLTKGASSREEMEVWKAKQSVAKAERLKATSAIEQANLDLEYSRITADINGRIGKAELTEGNLVNAGGSDPLLATIAKVDPILAYFNVDERSLQAYARQVGARGRNVTELLAALAPIYWLSLAVDTWSLGVQTQYRSFLTPGPTPYVLGLGQLPITASLKDARAEFTFAMEGDPEYKHHGRLAFSNNRIDPATGTILLYGTVDNENGFYIPGSRVRIRLPIDKPYEALLVPDTAVLTDQDKKYLLVVEDKDGKKVVQRRDVTLGQLLDDGMRAILPGADGKGVTASDWVIVEGLQRARINYPVDPVEQATPPGK
jgi:RND family efflux transporter MFP subunit